jgi:hypothetical protein
MQNDTKGDAYRQISRDLGHQPPTVDQDLYIPINDSSGVYIYKSVVNDLKHGNYICNSKVIYLTYEHRIEIPVEFTYGNQ